jgi:hypothetical protein
MTEAKMAYSFRPASRTEAKPLIGLYAESGAGKTYSALILARGFVGPEGRIGMIETESGRGEAYADPAEYPEIGGYDVLSLRDDFSPAAYGKAITAAEMAGLDALIIDSASHEWESTGGVLDMAAKNLAGGKTGVLAWQAPKIDHKKHFMLRFMQTPIPLVILCMRAKYPMREIKGGAKKEWVRSDKLEPTQADDILFEMFVHGWISQGDHKFHLTKCTAKALEPVFRDGAPVTIETGQQLRAWAGGQAVARKPANNGTAAPTVNGHVNELLTEAEAKAHEGTEALRAWWPTLPKAKKQVLGSHIDRLKDIAAGADDLIHNPPAEDPFGDEAA